MSTQDLAALVLPINENSPSGDDARYEFCYEMMEAEVKKFGSLFGETVSWPVVEQHSKEVLSQHSKDIKAICYLTRALMEESGFEGLVQGLTLFNQLLDDFGNALYPKRKRARDGAIEWFNHQIEIAARKLSINEDASQLLEQSLTLIGEVQQRFDVCFPDADADFFEVRSVLSEIKERSALVPESAPVKESAIEEPEQSKSDSIDTLSPAISKTDRLPESPSISHDSTTTPKVKQEKPEVEIDVDFSSPTIAKRTLKNVAEMLLSTKPGDPLAYRVYRHLTWEDIDSLPESRDQVTELRLAVSADQQAEFEEKSKHGGDLSTVKRLEKILTDAPFWITGHYYVFSMLNHLGYQQAADAVKQEVAALTKDLNGIEALKFKDQLPFASDETLRWIESNANSNTTSLQPSIFVDDEEDVSCVTLDNLGEHVANLATKLDQEGSGRGRFLLHLKMVKIYHQVGLYSLCMPYLESVLDICKESNLPQWEPHLAAQLNGLVEATLKALYPSDEQRPQKYQHWGLN